MHAGGAGGFRPLTGSPRSASGPFPAPFPVTLGRCQFADLIFLRSLRIMSVFLSVFPRELRSQLCSHRGQGFAGVGFPGRAGRGGRGPGGPPSGSAPGSLSQAEPSRAGPLGFPHALAGLGHGLCGHRLRLLLPRAVSGAGGSVGRGAPQCRSRASSPLPPAT